MATGATMKIDQEPVMKVNFLKRLFRIVIILRRPFRWYKVYHLDIIVFVESAFESVL